MILPTSPYTITTAAELHPLQCLLPFLVQRHAIACMLLREWKHNFKEKVKVPYQKCISHSISPFKIPLSKECALLKKKKNLEEKGDL